MLWTRAELTLDGRSIQKSVPNFTDEFNCAYSASNFLEKSARPFENRCGSLFSLMIFLRFRKLILATRLQTFPRHLRWYRQRTNVVSSYLHLWALLLPVLISIKFEQPKLFAVYRHWLDLSSEGLTWLTNLQAATLLWWYNHSVSHFRRAHTIKNSDRSTYVSRFWFWFAS